MDEQRVREIVREELEKIQAVAVGTTADEVIEKITDLLSVSLAPIDRDTP